MDKKELLIELCSNLERHLNMRESKTEQRHKVEFFSGTKPDGYYLPMIHIGTMQTLPDTMRTAWFVEVFVDGDCIFRENYLLREKDSLATVEDFLITMVIRKIFIFGIMSSKKILDDSKKKF